jgi:uncharacterized protein YndB with AHSA1/START domain
MAVVQCHIQASPEKVFSVLADGWRYSGWVVGTSHMRAVEPDWPEVGSHLYHASGIWPAVIRDETEVVEMERNRRLVIKAKGKAMGAARVAIDLEARDGGTRVTMDEIPVHGPGKWVHNPLNEQILRRRNVESLARLTVMAEEPAHPKD